MREGSGRDPKIENAAIHTEELTRSFDRGDGTLFEAVHNVSLDIQRGKVSILKGRSGSGKTTLLNLLSTLDDPTSGEVVFLGERLSAMTVRQKEALRRTKTGFVFQSVALIPVMSAYENVDFALRLAAYRGKRDQRIRELLELVGLPDRMHHMPGQLSGGEQQRVALAVALANDPVILLADEPTGAVDTTTARHIFRLLHRLNAERGLTILIVTHDRELAGQVNRTVRISDGKISTEKLRRIPLSFTDLAGLAPLKEQQEEYVVLDRARRLQLSEAVLEKAGIRSRMVKVEVEEGKVMITGAECPRHDSPDIY